MEEWDGWTMKDEERDSVQMGRASGRLPFLGLLMVAVTPLWGGRLLVGVRLCVCVCVYVPYG